MDKTTALYKELSVLADVEEWVETEGYAANVDDVRAKLGLGVLRRLLTGGLLSEEAQRSSQKDTRYSMLMWCETNCHAYFLGLPEL